MHAGEVFARSRLPKTPEASAGDNVHLWTHYIYTFLGEPEMALAYARKWLALNPDDPGASGLIEALSAG